MIKYRFLLIVCLLQFSVKGLSQTFTELKRNAVYTEFLGNGGPYSFNYERLSSIKSNYFLAARVGFSYLSIPYRQIAIPTELNFLIGNKQNLIETGFGITYVDNNQPYYDYNWNGFLRLGYRYQNKKGFLFRLGLTPNYILDQHVQSRKSLQKFYWWGGISLGYSFGKKITPRGRPDCD